MMKKYLFFFFLPLLFFSCTLTEKEVTEDKINGDEEISYYIGRAYATKLLSLKKNKIR